MKNNSIYKICFGLMFSMLLLIFCVFGFDSYQPERATETIQAQAQAQAKLDIEKQGSLSLISDMSSPFSGDGRNLVAETEADASDEDAYVSKLIAQYLKPTNTPVALLEAGQTMQCAYLLASKTEQNTSTASEFEKECQKRLGNTAAALELLKSNAELGDRYSILQMAKYWQNTQNQNRENAGLETISSVELSAKDLNDDGRKVFEQLSALSHSGDAEVYQALSSMYIEKGYSQENLLQSSAYTLASNMRSSEVKSNVLSSDMLKTVDESIRSDVAIRVNDIIRQCCSNQ